MIVDYCSRFNKNGLNRCICLARFRWLCGVALCLFVSITGTIQAEPVDSVDAILDQFDEINKTSLVEANDYLVSQEKSVKTLAINDQLRFYVFLADSYAYLLHIAEAKRVLQNSLEVSFEGLSESDRLFGEALKLVCLAHLQYLNRNFVGSLENFEKVGSYFREINDFEMLAYILSWIGDLKYGSGYYTEGYQAYREAGKLYDQLGKRNRVAEMLLSAGTSGVAEDLNDAMQNTLSVLKIFEEEGDLVGLAGVYQNMGYDFNPDINQSIGFFEKSIELSKQVGDISMQLAAIAGLAESLVSAERGIEAKSVIEEGLHLVEEFDAPDLAAHLYRVAGVVYTAEGTDASFKKAEAYFEQSLELYEEQGSVEVVQAVKEGQAELELERGSFESALPLAIEVTEWYRTNQEELLPGGLSLQKRIYEKMRDFQSALRVTEEYWQVIEEEWESGMAEKYEILQKDYETAQKKSEIDLLEKENLLKNQQIDLLQSKQRQSLQLKLFGSLLISAMVLMIIILFALMQTIRRNMSETLRTSKLLESQNQELSEANYRLKALSEQRKRILGMAAHDLKNPLASVSSSLEMLDIDLQPLAKDEAYAESIEILELSKQSVDYMRDLIDKMLNAALAEAKSGELHKETVRPAESVRQMVALNQTAAKKKSITIETECDDSLSVSADLQVLKEVIDNLLSNAVKYTPEGGKVFVSVGNTHCGPEAVNIVVADTGPGVPEEEISRLFDAFTNLSPVPTGGESSNGLGLSIARTLTVAMGGEIRFKNRASGGAEFTVCLPTV